LSEKPQNQVHV